MEIDILKSILFYGFSGAIVLFALLSIFALRITHALLSAVLTFFAVAGIFFMLGADYNAVIQIAIYGIAVPILFLFGIMFTSYKNEMKIYISTTPRFFFSVLSLGVLFLSLIYLIATSLSLKSNMDWISQKETVSLNKYLMFKAISDGFFSNYAFAFELFSLLLLVIVIGISTFNLRKSGSDE